MDTQAKDEIESAGLDDSFWGTIIIQAEQVGAFSEEAREMARSWQTCACGQQDPRLHDKNSIPLDLVHIKLGQAFSNAVEDDKFLEAALNLINIESRSIVLLAQL